MIGAIPFYIFSIFQDLSDPVVIVSITPAYFCSTVNLNKPVIIPGLRLPHSQAEISIRNEDYITFSLATGQGDGKPVATVPAFEVHVVVIGHYASIISKLKNCAHQDNTEIVNKGEVLDVLFTQPLILLTARKLDHRDLAPSSKCLSPFLRKAIHVGFLAFAFQLVPLDFLNKPSFSELFEKLQAIGIAVGLSFVVP
ncbi:hypothetical protein SE17_05285 [Kouleothrix aurantiaca]|uniref:Uncharacterized protein n=1 Tax=Kouleothrix aurantiaca TaxID=186479 RepID=A0A0P9DEU9_9CHLR|nr:hypothetical protein SE17_05285 [Kouleothrix aurantiaca]